MSERTRPGPPERLMLNSLCASRRTWARIVRSFYRDEMDESKFRALCYGFSGLCQLFKAEQGERLEERIAALELTMGAK
jgi:hypothetical protein